jgi:hypothetical protein
VVVICNVAGVILIDRDAVLETAGDSESTTFTVMGKVPLAVGVPLITPVAGARESPAGREPEEMDHVYGVVPPVAASVAE